jgi:D-amino-acid oxidase
VPGLVECVPAELPAGFRFGHRATVPLIDPPAHLAYLVARLAAAGGTVEPREVRALAEAAAAAPRVVNCTGTGARELVPHPAVRAVRGQHVVLANPGLDEYFIEVPTGPEWAGFFPHGDHIVLGGVAVDGDWSLEPDPAVAAGIVQRCAAIEPRLRGARVLAHQVGLRPERAGGVRLDEEWRDGVHVVHNYGHGGTGISLSWGCAREVAARVLAPAPRT